LITFLSYPFTSLGKIIGARIAYDAVQQQLADDPHLRIVFAAARSGLKPAIDGLQAIGLHPGMPIDTQELTQIVNSVVSLIQSEAFAQLTSLYYTAPEFTAEVLPRSYHFMQELTEAAHERTLHTAIVEYELRFGYPVSMSKIQEMPAEEATRLLLAAVDSGKRNRVVECPPTIPGALTSTPPALNNSSPTAKTMSAMLKYDRSPDMQKKTRDLAERIIAGQKATSPSS